MVEAPTVVSQVVTKPAETEEDKQRWFAHEAAFGLPEGTVRAAIALLVIGADLFMNCWYKWAPESLDTWATVAFTYYFVSAAMGPAGVRATAKIAVVLGALLLATSAQAALFQTEQVSVGPTPSIVGTSSGRSRIRIKNADPTSTKLRCGSSERPIVAEFYNFGAGEAVEIGDGGTLWGGSTAEVAVLCASADATPQVVAIVEEGRMPPWTQTPTNTPTNTPVDTDTPTVTPTPTQTPTVTP